MCASSLTLLEQLAQSYGIQTAYYDMAGRLMPASPEAMLAVLRSLGAAVVTLADVPSALRERRQALWQQPVKPVIAVCNNEPQTTELRLPSSMASAFLRAYLKLECGEEQDPYWRIADLPELESAEVEGERYVVRRLPLPQGLPWGYHRLVLELPGKSCESLFIAAPPRAYSLPKELAGRLWGVFMPLHALHTQRSWGSGDFSDMEHLVDWVTPLGGSIVATLPLLASFFDGVPPSPYTPVSRLFWNEFYVDLRKIPELEKCPKARALLSSSPFQREIQTLRSLPLVDYNRQMSLKRRVLDELAKRFFAGQSKGSADFQRFVASQKAVEDYARFRATGERLGISWSNWPEPLRNGLLQPGDYDETAKQYHLYAQWVAQEQLGNLSRKAKQKGLGLYLDLPLGTHPCGYDVWRERDIFVPHVSVGAPPDPVFTSGQNWNFPPLHPEKIRTQGYHYIIACVRHHLSQASILRIDHVMSFHRLFWIPEGMENSQGLYLHYHPEEFYAIMALESQRQQAIIVGEDLGLVPAEVRPAMTQHGLYRMYITQYELTAEQQNMKEAPADAIASLNTHDMFPFSAFWQEMDIGERKRLGLVDEATAQQEAEQRRRLKKALVSLLQNKGLIKEAAPETGSVLRGTLSLLSSSPAQAVIVNLEDLWHEMQPQNIPGTKKTKNWRRKARYSLEEFSDLPLVTDALKEIDRIRKGVP